MRFGAFLVATGLVAGCGAKGGMTALPVATPTPVPADPGPAMAAHFEGLWAGTASVSPMGKKPYALFFMRDGSKLVAETPTELSEEALPPGAYQRFVFEDAPSAGKLAFATALGTRGTGEGVLMLDAARSTATVWHYAADAAMPRRLELRFEKVGTTTLRFQTLLGGQLHMDVTLAPWKDDAAVTGSAP